MLLTSENIILPQNLLLKGIQIKLQTRFLMLF